MIAHKRIAPAQNVHRAKVQDAQQAAICPPTARRRLRRLFTFEEYLKLWDDRSVLGKGPKTELLEGEIFTMSAQGTKHFAVVSRILRLFSKTLAEDILVSSQSTIRLSPKSAPEPDVALLRFREDFYANAHPTPQDILLLVEVSDTTLRFDSSRKARLYARSGVVEYWIVDCKTDTIEVCREPQNGEYSQRFRLNVGDVIRPEAAPNHAFDVADITG